LGAISALLFFIVCGVSAARNQEKPMTQEDSLLRPRRAYVSLVLKAQGDDFKPVPKTGAVLADRAWFGSLTWCDRVFRVPIHDPGDKVEHSYHVARPGVPIDLLLHRLTVDKVPVRIYEASSFFVVMVPAASLPADDPAVKSSLAVKLLFSADAPSQFKPLSSGPNEHAYCTDPNRSPWAIGDWKRRIDSVTLGADLAMVVYKANYDDMMTMMSDPAAWFEELRKAK